MIDEFKVNGDGTRDDLLPGTRVNQFNRGLDKDDLARLVDSYNQEFADKPTRGGQKAPRVTLPADYAFGDSFFTQDVRLTRTFPIGARGAMQLGAYWAGLAIENSMLGAAHACANPLTAQIGVPCDRLGRLRQDEEDLFVRLHPRYGQIVSWRKTDNTTNAGLALRNDEPAIVDTAFGSIG